MSLITTAEILSGVGFVSAQAENEQIEVTENTSTMGSGTYIVKKDVTIDANKRSRSAPGITVEKGAKVLLIIEEGKTLTVQGDNGTWKGIGYAGILLPEGSTLTVTGKGTLNATGGSAGEGVSGSNAGYSYVEDSDDYMTVTGDGGSGDDGGGGAGAGIGTKDRR